MFDIGWSELVIVGIVALIVIGPKELPGVLRMVGQWIGKVRRMASDFQGQFQEAMREAEMADLKKQVDEFADSTRDVTTHFDPLETMQEAVDDAFADKPKIADTGTANAAPEGADQAAAPTVTPEQPRAEAAPAEPAAPEPAPPPAETTAEDAPPQKAAAGGHSA